MIVRSIRHIWLCLLLVWINSTWCHPNNIFFDEELSITDLNHKQEGNTSQDKNSIQTPKNGAKHKCNQHIWDEEGWFLEAHCPILCQSLIQLLVWMILKVSCKMQKWATNYGWKRSLMKCCATSMRQQLYLNSPKWCQIQIRATNMRWEGTSFSSLLPYLVSMPNTVIGNKWLSHYVAKQKCDDQI